MTEIRGEENKSLDLVSKPLAKIKTTATLFLTTYAPYD